MNEEEYSELLDDLLKLFSREYIFNTGKYLYNLADKFLHERKITDKVYINDKLFYYCLIDMLVDIMRLRCFHDIKNLSPIKYRAYAASCWLRRKPFQCKQEAGDIDLCINERFALTIMLQALDHNIYTWSSYDREKASKTTQQALYHLKYRNTNPQTLELFLTGLNTVK